MVWPCPTSATFMRTVPPVTGTAAKRRGKVRRAKLYYLRGRRGKSARIAEGAHHGGQTTDVAEAENK